MSDASKRPDLDTVEVGTGPLTNVHAGTTPPSGPQRLANRYDILSLAGVGGMGAVYRARDLELDEIVALKMLRRELLNDDATLDRFRREVKLARRVTHRNVARTFDIGEHGGDKFLTMEFVDGESLAALIARRGKLPLAEVVEILEPICAGLAAAHSAGVIHRDLKPENVLIARDGRVVITDFGIARAGLEQARAGTKHAVGTPEYMAPEQVEGRADIDARADIYALGVILYEMLTGRAPWSGDSVYSVAVKRLVEPPPDPRAKTTDVSDAAARVTLRCMAMDRADRYACVADVTGALAGLTLPVPLAVTGSSPTSSSVVRTTTGIGTKAVAVLPLRNLGPPEDEYLADGLTDDLIDNLSMTGGIRVRSRGMVMGLRGADRDPRELGRDLGVQVVVLGSVRRAGDRLRVQARVISVADGFQLWAKRFDCPASDFLAVGDEMVRAVADALTGTGEPPRPRQPPADPAAIDLYLRARHAHHTAWRDAGRVVGLFQQALARAPDDPMFLSGYAMAQIRVFAHDDGASLAGEEAKLAAERALAVAPELGEARVALATYLLCVGDAVGAAREVTRALASSPGLADAHDLAGRILIEAGASDQGVASLKRALSFEPRLTVSAMALAREHALRGEETLAEEMLRMGEHDPVTETVRGYTRARLALWTGDRERVKTVLGVLGANGAALGPFESLRAFAGGPLGDPRDGLELARLATAGGKAARRRSFYGQIRAELYLFLGEREMALTALEGADAAHLFDVVWLDRCPIFAPLRGDPRFVAVRAHVAERARLVLEAFGIASP